MSKLYKVLSIVFFIFSVFIAGFLYIQKSNTQNYWGNDIYGSGLWLHPSNQNLEGIYIIDSVKGLLSSLQLDEVSYRFKIVDKNGGLREVVFGQDSYKENYTKILVNKGSEIISDNWDINNLIDFILTVKLNDMFYTPEIEIITSKNIESSSVSFDYIILNL